MSELDTRLGDALAETLNTLSSGMGASAKSLRFEEMLARLHNLLSDGPDLSRLTSSVPEMLAGIYNAGVGDSSATAKNMSVPALLAGIANAFSDDPDVTRQTTSLARLWNLALTNPRTGGGGSPPAYETGAVALDGLTYLVNNALVSNDTGAWSFSFWLYFLSDALNDPAASIGEVDPQGIVGSNISIGLGKQFLNAYESTGTDGVAYIETNTVSAGAWHHFMGCCDISQPAPGKFGKMLMDGVDFPLSVPPQYDVGGAQVAAFNGFPYWVFSDRFGGILTGYGADVWIAPGQSLLNGSGVIPPATIAKFYSAGRPVDLGADGSTPTGTAPAIFLRATPGNEVATFPINRGTGGPFSVVGALTAAPSSPSTHLDARPSWLPAGATGGVDFTVGEAYFGGVLITDLSEVLNYQFDPAAVGTGGMVVDAGNANRPSMIGYLLQQAVSLPYAAVIEFQAGAAVDSGTLFSIADDYYDPSNKWFSVFFDTSTDPANALSFSADFANPSVVVGHVTEGVASKFAFSVNYQEILASLNGATAVSQPLSANPGAMNQAQIGWTQRSAVNNDWFIDGPIKRFIFYPNSMTAGQVAALSA